MGHFDGRHVERTPSCRFKLDQRFTNVIPPADWKVSKQGNENIYRTRGRELEWKIGKGQTDRQPKILGNDWAHAATQVARRCASFVKVNTINFEDRSVWPSFSCPLLLYFFFSFFFYKYAFFIFYFFVCVCVLSLPFSSDGNAPSTMEI